MFIIGGTSVGASKALEDCIHHFNFSEYNAYINIKSSYNVTFLATSRWEKDLVHNTDTIKYQHAHAVNVWISIYINMVHGANLSVIRFGMIK
jgi:hypothetical protein